MGVKFAASQLNIACGKPSKMGSYKSGWATAGELDRIRVTLEWVKPFLDDGGGNVTVARDDA